MLLNFIRLSYFEHFYPNYRGVDSNEAKGKYRFAYVKILEISLKYSRTFLELGFEMLFERWPL